MFHIILQTFKFCSNMHILLHKQACFVTDYQQICYDIENGCKPIAKNLLIDFKFIFICPVAISLQICYEFITKRINLNVKENILYFRCKSVGKFKILQRLSNGILKNILKNNIFILPLQIRCKSVANVWEFSTDLQRKIFKCTKG